MNKMGPKTGVEYDEERLVERIGEGKMTYAQIAEELEVSESLVKKVACGQRRPELQKRIWQAESILLDAARRLGAAASRRLIVEQIRTGLDGEGETARRAREFVLKFAASHHPDKKDLPGPLDALLERQMLEDTLACMQEMGMEDVDLGATAEGPAVAAHAATCTALPGGGEGR